MTDLSSFGIPLEKRITSSMMYGLKPSAPTSRSYRLSLAPQNKSTFVPGDQVIFEIPTGRGKNVYLDQSQCYYKFGVQISTTAACNIGGSGVYVDNTAYSFINQQYIYNGGTQLEFINQYGQLANYLIDNTMSKSQKSGMSSMIGSNAYNNLIVTTAGAAASTAGGVISYGGGITSGITQIEGDRSGQSLIPNATTYGNISTGPVNNFTLPILSGIIGANASKMLPISALKVPLRVELFLSANDDAIYYGTAGAGATWQIVNLEMELCYVEIDSDTPLVNTNEPIYISGSTYRQASATLTAAQSGEWTTLLPFRFSSMNSIYARFRNMASAVQGANATAGYRLSSSINPNIGNWYYRIGQGLYPSKPVYLMNGVLVGSGNEAMAELQKSFHSLATVTGEPSYNTREYNVAPNAYPNGLWQQSFQPASKQLGNVDTFANAFSIGLELQTFSNTSDTILCGTNTQNTQMFFTANIYSGLFAGGTANPPINYTVDFFAGYDFVLEIRDGVASVVL